MPPCRGESEEALPHQAIGLVLATSSAQVVHQQPVVCLPHRTQPELSTVSARHSTSVVATYVSEGAMILASLSYLLPLVRKACSILGTLHDVTSERGGVDVIDLLLPLKG